MNELDVIFWGWGLGLFVHLIWRQIFSLPSMVPTTLSSSNHDLPFSISSQVDVERCLDNRKIIELSGQCHSEVHVQSSNPLSVESRKLLESSLRR
jgi:hypothetical protein